MKKAAVVHCRMTIKVPYLSLLSARLAFSSAFAALLFFFELPDGLTTYTNTTSVLTALLCRHCFHSGQVGGGGGGELDVPALCLGSAHHRRLGYVFASSCFT